MFQKLKRFRWKTSLTTLHKPFKKFFLFLHDFSILVGEKMTQFTQCTKNSSPPHFQLLCQMVKLFRGERGLKVPKFYFCNSNIETRLNTIQPISAILCPAAFDSINTSIRSCKKTFLNFRAKIPFLSELLFVTNYFLGLNYFLASNYFFLRYVYCII